MTSYESETELLTTKDAAPASLTRHSRLALAALASLAIDTLHPVRLAIPQWSTEDMQVVGVIDSQGRHWEVIEAFTPEAALTLDTETEALRQLIREADAGMLSFTVPRPGGVFHRDDTHVVVRSYVPGSELDCGALHVGPGLSAGLGRALGQLHELHPRVIADAGLPVYDAIAVQQRWCSAFDDAAGTGLIPPSLLQRWEDVLNETSVWHFKPTVVHGDLAEDAMLTAGGAVVGMRGFARAHVGDPAEDLAWLYASVLPDVSDTIESAYELARPEGVDRHLRRRAEFISEMGVAQWLLHGISEQEDSIIDDACAMIQDLAQAVGDEPLVPHRETLSVAQAPAYLSSESGSAQRTAEGPDASDQPQQPDCEGPAVVLPEAPLGGEAPLGEEASLSSVESLMSTASPSGRDPVSGDAPLSADAPVISSAE